MSALIRILRGRLGDAMTREVSRTPGTERRAAGFVPDDVNAPSRTGVRSSAGPARGGEDDSGGYGVLVLTEHSTGWLGRLPLPKKRRRSSR